MQPAIDIEAFHRSGFMCFNAVLNPFLSRIKFSLLETSFNSIWNGLLLKLNRGTNFQAF
jgi:hypothetical protein